MARPRKSTVDYFPHGAIEDTVVHMMEQVFGDKGYVFWFKLQERLCQTDGLCIDLNNPSERRYLLAKTGVDETKLGEMLRALADVGAVDRDVLELGKIWSQPLVDSVVDAFRRRTSLMPKHPITGVFGGKIELDESIRLQIEKKVNLNKNRKGNISSEPTDGTVLFRHYQEAFRAKYGVDSLEQRNGQNATTAKNLVEQLGLEEAKRLVTLYFEHNAPYVLEHKHPFWLIPKKAQQLLVKKPGKKIRVITNVEDLFKDPEPSQPSPVVAPETPSQSQGVQQ